MEMPALQLPLRDPRAPWMPQLLQPFVPPETFYPRGSANQCQLPGQEQPSPAAWAPMAAPPAGLQTAPCGCFFNPEFFRIQWMSTDPTPPVTSTLSPGAAPLLGAAPWGSRGCRTPLAWAAFGSPQGQHFMSFNLQGRAAALAPLVLPQCFPGYQDMEKQFAEISLSNTAMATAVGAALGRHVLSSSAAPHTQAAGGPAGDLPVPRRMLLDCSLGIQDSPSGVPMLEGPGGTARAASHCDIASLSLPAELLSPDYDVLETSDAVLSLQQFNTIGMGPQEMWWDAEMELPPS